jgi:glycosyltransferase involved in cell wall biosynthesis
MHLLKKSMQHLIKYGIFHTIIKVFDKCDRIIKLLPYQLLEAAIPYCQAYKLESLKALVRQKDVYIVIPNIDWYVPLYQRPHQLAAALSSRSGSHVLFVSDQYRYDRFAFMKSISANLSLYSLRMADRLNDALASASSVTVLMCWTRHYGMLDLIRHDKLIYDYMDELQLFYYHDAEMSSIHHQLMRRADLTVVTASALYNNALPYARRLLLCENAGDYDFFSRSKMIQVNSKLRAKAKSYSAVLGYYGCLACWFDYRTIKLASELRHDWLFAIVGFDFDGSMKSLELDSHPNIMHFPAQPYRELPSFLNGFDVALIPFINDKITDATSPVKLFEYMAAGKPILASDLPECRKYGSVCFYHDADEFILKIETLLTKKNDEEYLALLEKEAKENTWDARIELMLESV